MVMYTIFYNDKHIRIKQLSEGDLIEDKQAIIVYKKKSEIIAAIHQLEINNAITSVIILHHDVDEVLKTIKRIFKPIDAAGGLVKNRKNEYLLIFRNGKWDLPKGKVERNEKIEDAAVREVEEECGIKQLQIIKPLPSTFHVYTLKDKKVLKHTYWFEMLCKDDAPLKPQLEEGITDAQWMGKKDTITALNNSFASIRDMAVTALEKL